MEPQSGKTIISGIEPVDELMGGLDRGQLYLVHGEASGKSLFGIKVLIEGLKRGENGALVIRYSPEDAVRRFARLGYDCLEDVYSGRLVILEYSDDIVQKIGKLPELTPVLRELEWLLGETRPERLIFDPVTSVLAGTENNLDKSAHEFAAWARSFGATVVLIANDTNNEIIRCFKSLVAESFRFDVRETNDRAARFLAFEKTAAIADQAIEVDPSRGVFLLGRLNSPEHPAARQAAPKPPSIAELASIREELRAARERTPKEEIDYLSVSASPVEAADQTDRLPVSTDSARDAGRAQRDTAQTRKFTPAEERTGQARWQTPAASGPTSIAKEELDFHFEANFESSEALQGKAAQSDELSDLLDELTGTQSPLDLDFPEVQSAPPDVDNTGIDLSDAPVPVSKQHEVRSQEAKSPFQRIQETAYGRPDAVQAEGRMPGHSRASDHRIDSSLASRAAELLLSPPESGGKFSLPPIQAAQPRAAREVSQPMQLGDAPVRTKDFNVLVIEDAAESHDLVTETLGDYTLAVAHDGVSGLAKLLSLKPDLVILDFDLPIVDGFKVLTLIRSALDVPVIVLSGSRVRAIDRVMASELGADYYLTKPFSTKELKQKARQLIARYRGINSWITNPASSSRSVPPARPSEAAAQPTGPGPEMFVPYTEFAVEVEKRVQAAMDTGAPFSIVGCRLPQMTANRGLLALQLFEIVRQLARDTDLTSTNERNDMMVLLADADTSGARAFAGRLQERIVAELKNEPALWMRSFPDLEESTEATTPGRQAARGGATYSRSRDAATHP